MLVRRIFVMWMIAAALVWAAPAAAEDNEAEAVAIGARGRIAEHLWGPRQILKHRDELKLTEAQDKAIRKLVKDGHIKLIDLRYDLDAETQALEKLLAQPRIDEAAAIAKSQRVMALESEIKITTMRMLIQIKNTLTPEQQKLLASKQLKRRKRLLDRAR